jgi:sugar lactone lactonase YvrE
MTTAERLAAAGLVLGEGPIHLGGGRYACVDIRQRKIFGGDLDGEIAEIRSFDEPVSAVCLLDDGKYLVAKGTSVEILDHPQRTIRLPKAASDVRLNDGKADPAGRFVAGTMADPPRTGAGTLWSFRENSAMPLLRDVTISNGLCWGGGGDIMYYIDTPTLRIDAFDYDQEMGTVHNRRTFATIADGLGYPDGMTIDTDGGLWVAMWGGGSVLRFHDGKLDDRIDVPTPYVTCPTFIGSQLDTLLITTASEPIPKAPGAGDLYVARTGSTGTPAMAASASLVFGSAVTELTGTDFDEP